MENKAHLLEFATRLVYSVEGISTELKVYWSQVLAVIFSDTLQDSQIQFTESSAATRSFKRPEEINEFTTTLSREDLVWSLALVHTLYVRAELLKDQLAAKRINWMMDQIITANQLEMEKEKIVDQYESVHSQLLKFEKRPVVKIPLRIWPIALDFFLRCLVVVGFNMIDSNPDPLRKSLNIMVIPVVILVVVFMISRRDKRFNQKLLKVYGGGQQFRLRFEISSMQYTLLALSSGSSVFINYLLNTGEESIGVLSFLLLLGLIGYYTICLRYFSVGQISENDLVKQVSVIHAHRKVWDADENDEAIIRLETKLNATTSRLEAYVLESALFGALSFSGFLQIIANNIISVQDMDRFAQATIQTSKAFVYADWENVNSGLAALDMSASLFCLVSVESLLCSILFLAVIASRLQFSDVADKVRDALNLAKVYNAKEEGLIEKEGLTPKSDERLRLLNVKVNVQLERTEEAAEELEPVIRYMQYFRNGGILVFLIILVTSSLFITGMLAWAFAVLGLATWLYFKRESISHQVKATYLTIRVQFISRGAWLLVVALISFALAFLLRIQFGWDRDNCDLLLVFGFLVLGLYGYIWIVFSPHYDAAFGEIEPTRRDPFTSSNWKIARNIFGYSILIASVSLSLKWLHFAGSNLLWLISLTLLAISVYVLGYYLSKRKLLGVLMGSALACSFIGILFKILHFAGANVMLLVGLIGLLIISLVVYFKRRIFHKLLIRICILPLLMNVFLLYGYRIGVAYEQRTFSNKEYIFISQEMDDVLKEYADIIDDPKDKQVQMAELKTGIEKCNAYIDKYDNRLGLTRYYTLRYEIYASFIDMTLDSVSKRPGAAGDSLSGEMLQTSLLAARQIRKIDSLFNFEYFHAREADVLMAMGRKEKAIQSLNTLLLSNPSTDFKELLNRKLKKLESQ